MGYSEMEYNFQKAATGLEMPGITEFYITSNQLRGLQEGEDTLTWRKHSSEIYTISTAYKDRNQE